MERIAAEEERNVTFRRLLGFRFHNFVFVWPLTHSSLDMGRLTEKPNRYPIFLKTDTDTDFGILKTEKYRKPTKNNR